MHEYVDFCDDEWMLFNVYHDKLTVKQTKKTTKCLKNVHNLYKKREKIMFCECCAKYDVFRYNVKYVGRSEIVLPNKKKSTFYQPCFCLF